jgi:hypothetical protein
VGWRVGELVGAIITAVNAADTTIHNIEARRAVLKQRSLKMGEFRPKEFEGRRSMNSIDEGTD